uniref:Uncharacterized protein n=1 Tax=Megaselia scalaris TaxID=36166 RepID=T1H216_MEGSC
MLTICNMYLFEMGVNTSQKVCKKVGKPALGFAETAEAVFANGPICLRNWSNVARNFVDCSLIATYW